MQKMEILRELDVYLSREDAQLFRVVSNSKFVSAGGKWYEKKIETNFSSCIVSDINMEHMWMATAGIGSRFAAADRG